MAHARDSIREAVRDRLAAIPGLEANITFDDARITGELDAPWCYVWLSDEDVESVTIGLRPKKQRSVQLQIDVIARDRYEAAKQSESLAALIEDRIDQDPTFSRLVKSTTLRALTVERASDAQIQRLRLTYIVNYWTEAGNAAATV